MLQAALFIFILRVVDVAAMTLRILMIMRGRKAPAWVLGFMQALLFVVAIRAVLADLGNLANIIGYAAGFATGTVVGMYLEEWLAVGYGHVRVISSAHGAELAEKLRAAGYAATELAGRGRDGTVAVINCSVPRRVVGEVRRLVTETDPEAFITVEDVRPIYRGFFRRPGRQPR